MNRLLMRDRVLIGLELSRLMTWEDPREYQWRNW